MVRMDSRKWILIGIKILVLGNHMAITGITGGEGPLCLFHPGHPGESSMGAQRHEQHSKSA
jgi:hypothetical protein